VVVLLDELPLAVVLDWTVAFGATTVALGAAPVVLPAVLLVVELVLVVEEELLVVTGVVVALLEPEAKDSKCANDSETPTHTYTHTHTHTHTHTRARTSNHGSRREFCSVDHNWRTRWLRFRHARHRHLWTG